MLTAAPGATTPSPFDERAVLCDNRRAVIHLRSLVALPLLAVLAQGESAVDVRALTGPQLDALAWLSVITHQTGFVTAQLFFSAWLFPLGWLVLRSGFLPRFLGWLLLLDGVAVLVWFMQVLLAPGYPAISYPSWAVGFVAEVGLALWLLVRGVPPQVPDHGPMRQAE